jgi:hypothetical protein
MTEAVDGDPPDARRANHVRESPRADVIDVEWRAEDVMPALCSLGPLLGEDETAVPILESIPHLELGLMHAMGSEQLDRLRGEVDGSSLQASPASSDFRIPESSAKVQNAAG